MITLDALDNNGNVTQTHQYNTSIATANLIRQSKSPVDWLGRRYQTEVDGVTLGSGPSGNILTSNTWFDAFNRPVKDMPAGSQGYTKTAYDLAERLIGRYTGYSPASNDSPWTIGTNDRIFEQTLGTFDAAGNTLLVSIFQRNNGDLSTTGALSAYPGSRVSYTAFWQDGIGRQIASADYGTNNPGTLPLTPPPSTAAVLVGLVAYNARGEAFLTTDPAGTVTRSDSDDAGRQIRMIQNYQPVAPLSSGAGPLSPLHHPLRGCPGEGQGEGCGCASSTTGPDVNVTTLTTYTPDDNVSTLTAVNPATGNQTTRYLYGTTLATSAIARNDLLAAVIYPDAADSADSVSLEYNRQSQVSQRQDQNGTQHQFGFDGLGRQIQDIVAQLGTNVDGTVRRIDTAYEIRGMVNLLTSYGNTGGTAIVNQVTLAYNDFAQLISDEQDLSASGGPTHTVGYAYVDGPGNTSRPMSVTYPYSTGSRTVSLNYALGDDDSLSRVTSLAFAGGTVAAYGYFGLGSVASTTLAAGAINSTLATSAPAYPGFDIFGRVVDLPWVNSSSALVAGLGYGYNQASSRTYRADLMAEATSSSLPFDELYGYDGLQRLVDFHRGSLTSGNTAIDNPSLQQGWGLDATGNWQDFTQFDLTGAIAPLDQQRVSNTANEITAISQTVGTAANWVTPAYDRAGNMVTMPQPLAAGSAYVATFDAWQRLMTLTDPSTGDTVQKNQYDGRNFRVARLTYTGGSLSETRYFVFSSQWQVLEEYVASTSLTVPDRQYVWGLRYIDDLVLRDRGVSGTLNERLYALQDANWNAVAISNAAGAVQERYNYTAYGVSTVLNPDFSIKSGGTAFDWTVLYTGRELDSETGVYYHRARYYLALWEYSLAGIRFHMMAVSTCTGMSTTARCRWPIPRERSRLPTADRLTLPHTRSMLTPIFA